MSHVNPPSPVQVRRDFADIILPESLHNNVRLVAASAANTKRHGAPFRHMLFYGEAGPHTLAGAAAKGAVGNGAGLWNIN